MVVVERRGKSLLMFLLSVMRAAAKAPVNLK
jgi:hypothetical protein